MKKDKEAIARAVKDRVQKERSQLAGARDDTGGEPQGDSPYFLRDGYLYRSMGQGLCP